MSLLHVPAHLWRLLRIGGTMARSGALACICAVPSLGKRTRFALRAAAIVLRPFGKKGDPDLPPMARAFTALGPAEVKLGQMLSTRPDVVGAEIAAELRSLQDRVPPFDDAEARRIVAEELGAPVEELFTEFSPAIAAASIAQVHKAVTPEGRTVAVKVLRPGIEQAFLRDIDAFRFVAKVIEFVLPSARRLKPVAVYDHFEEVTRIELDLRLEAAAASEYAAATEADKYFRVPGVDWARSSQRVMTSDWIDGTPIADRDALIAQGIDPVPLGERIIESFLRQGLRDGLFHGDMHQGNLLVDAQGRIVALDFGIMGRLDPLTRRFYADILLSFVKRDYERAARVHREAGYLPDDQPIHAFAQALRAVAEPIFGVEARYISMARLLGQLFAVTERFGMETQTQLLLLQKTMVMVEGVARDLDPDVNMWNAARPVLEEWMRKNIGPEGIARDLKSTAEILLGLGPRLPQAAERLVMLLDQRTSEHGPFAPPPAVVHVRAPFWPVLLAAVAGGGVGAGVLALFLGVL